MLNGNNGEQLTRRSLVQCNCLWSQHVQALGHSGAVDIEEMCEIWGKRQGLIEAALSVWLPQMCAVYCARAWSLPIKTALWTVLLSAADTVEKWCKPSNAGDAPVNGIVGSQSDTSILVGSMLPAVLLPNGLPERQLVRRRVNFGLDPVDVPNRTAESWAH